MGLLVCGGLAVAAAPAAARPVEYVKICSAYGIGYYYIPGTDQCAYSGQMPYKADTPYGTITNTPGSNSTAYGVHAFSYGDNSLAIGNGAWSGGNPTSGSPGADTTSNPWDINGMVPGSAFFNAGTTAIGTNAQAGAGAGGEVNATALGESATANAVSATALGQGANASADNSVALGAGSVADTANTVSVGSPGNERQIVNVAPGTISATSTDVVVGSQLYSTMQSISALQASIGAGAVKVNTSGTASATGTNAMAIGGSAQATQSGGIAVGQGASSTGQNAIAIGTGAQATASNATALGAGAIANQSNTVSVGSPGNEQRITNLAPGTATTDAVNFGQLQDVANRADGGTAAALAFAGIPPLLQHQKVTLGLGYGNWNSSSGFAIGGSARLGQWFALKGGAAFDNHGHTGISAGFGIGF